MTIPDTVKSAIEELKGDLASCTHALPHTSCNKRAVEIVLEAATSAINLQERVNLLEKYEQINDSQYAKRCHVCGCTAKWEHIECLVCHNNRLVEELSTSENHIQEIGKVSRERAERVKELEGAVEGAEKALQTVRKLISEAANNGFNYTLGGDWPQRLFLSQQETSATLEKLAAVRKKS